MPTYAYYETDDGDFYVNEYYKERRETLYDSLSEEQAQEIVALLMKYAAHRCV